MGVSAKVRLYNEIKSWQILEMLPGSDKIHWGGWGLGVLAGESSRERSEE
tara:strand:- start:77 stop:226 length:150 start_codon:yes stop_codon:yes gene_type:complete